MPGRNIVKTDSPDTFYHVYARGQRKTSIYQDDEDYRVFLNLFKRYLGKEVCKDPFGRCYPNFQNEIELTCYCLMSNHFHLLLFQKELGAMTKLMKNILTSYSRYFNKKYHYSGSLFETTYKASTIMSDQYLLHISRYIHINPDKWEKYPYSSLVYFTKHKEPNWLNSRRVLDLFDSTADYVVFLKDYDDYKKSLEMLVSELANTIIV